MKSQELGTKKTLFLLLVFFISNGIALAIDDSSNQKMKISTRTLSDDEFLQLKSKMGVYEEGVNYNVKINGFGTGLIPPKPEQLARMKSEAIMVDNMLFDNGVIPTSHDNSATKWFPPIGQQGSENSCVAWAAGYYNKTFQEAMEHDWDLSACTWENGFAGYPSAAYQDKIFSPDFIYHQINDGVDGGAYYYDAMDLLYGVGCCTWNKMPYSMSDHTSWPSETAWRQAPLYRSGTSHNYVNVTNDTNIGNLKQFLANYNNAIIAIDANYYPSLTSNDLWTSDAYLATGSNHANLIVGYDDNFGPYTEGGVSKYGAFKVANSWGKGSWENVYDGFYWISYECMKQKIGYYMFYENRVDYEPEVISVFSMEHSLRGECDVTIGIGNSSSPNATKRFDNYYSNGGNHAYPSNIMVLDITEFGTPEIDDNFFIKVYDKGTTTVGKINSFSIETYNDYSSGTPTATITSDDTPVNTVNRGNVYAQLQIISSVPLDLGIPTTTVTSSDNQCFNAQNNIVVAGTGNVIVQSGASANFIAGHSVQFLPGFHAENGSYVDVHITSNGSFCDVLTPSPLMGTFDPPAEKSVGKVEPHINENDLLKPQSMLVYPNPNNGQFILLLNNFEGVTRVFIYNAMGQKVYDVSVSDEKHFVELPNVQGGIYFVKVINNQKQFNQKIVIN